MKIDFNKTENKPRNQDITALVLEFQQKYRNVFAQQIGDEVFIYRSLGRGEYKELLLDDRIDDIEKEEVVCETCVLFPENYDFQNCDAGTPTILYQAIIKNSLLDSVESRKAVLNYYRNEMFDLDSQITCIINEAFPQFDIEEIDQWDVEKTTKYLSRAEWKLHHLRNIPFVDMGEAMESFYEKVDQNNIQPKTEEIVDNKQVKSKKEKLTPEKLAELKAKYPEIDWENDSVVREGVDAFKNKNFDTLSPALRPGFPFVRHEPEKE